jgi:hypothetical protein
LKGVILNSSKILIYSFLWISGATIGFSLGRINTDQVFSAISAECWDREKMLFKAQGQIKVHKFTENFSVLSTNGQKFHISGKCVASEVMQ